MIAGDRVYSVTIWAARIGEYFFLARITCDPFFSNMFAPARQR
jgi:hypothetical protein